MAFIANHAQICSPLSFAFMTNLTKSLMENNLEAYSCKIAHLKLHRTKQYPDDKLMSYSN